MNAEKYNEIINDRILKCTQVLCAKSDEYATADKLHNFKVAANLQGCTPIKALAGMMCKHTVSVYDLIRDNEYGKQIPKELWEEKIVDSINYLLILTALIEEQEGEKVCSL